MEENFMVSDLEDFTIKEKEYRTKKRKKILFITIPSNSYNYCNCFSSCIDQKKRW